METLPKLSPAQSLMLRTTSHRADGQLMPPDTLRGVARVKVMTALLTKLAAMLVALRRPQGATSLQLMLATGWQPHTVRGAISGMLRKKLGLNVVLAHNDRGERVYRVV